LPNPVTDHSAIHLDRLFAIIHAYYLISAVEWYVRLASC
jgi:hypothetical protein